MPIENIKCLKPEEELFFNADKSAKSFDDLAFVEGLDEDEEVEQITKILKDRLINKQDMYTSIGHNVLVALNPYQILRKGQRNIYDDEVALHYWNRTPHLTAPHVFKLTAQCMHHLMNHRSNQVMIISGESGSGKTETAKHVLHFATAIANLSNPFATSKDKGHAELVARSLLDSNPVLEGFGNAATLKNDNSSRFGKLLELSFSGAYGLLDDPKPTNRKGFVQSAEHQKTYKHDESDEVDSWRYMIGADEADDMELLEKEAPALFESIVKALAGLKVRKRTCRQVWGVLAALLHLGQMTYVEKTEEVGGSNMGCDVTEGGLEENVHLNHAARLLGVDPTALFRALSEKVLGAVGRRTSIQVQYLDKTKASANRDALAKEIYSRLFDWVLRATNRAISNKVNNDSIMRKDKIAAQRSISVLDIFGFEIFEVNGFEQLLINYANERLQLFFIENSLRQEREEYEKEGINMENITISDNRHVCKLLDSPLPTAGVFTLLNELAFSQGMKGGSKSPRKSKTGSSVEDQNVEDSRVLLEMFDEKLQSKAFYPQGPDGLSPGSPNSKRLSSIHSPTPLSLGASALVKEELVFNEDSMCFEKQPLPEGYVYDEINMMFVRSDVMSNKSSTSGIVFDEKGMFFRRRPVPEGFSYDERKMIFVKASNQRKRGNSNPPPPQFGTSLSSKSFGSPSSSPSSISSPSSSSPTIQLPRNASMKVVSRSPYRGSRHYMSRKENGDLAGQLFGIRHYAGEVSYHAATMVRQNTDALFSDVLHLLAASDSSFVAALFAEDPETCEKNAEERAHLGPDSDSEGEVEEDQGPESESEEEDEAAIAARMAKAVAKRRGGGGEIKEDGSSPSSPTVPKSRSSSTVMSSSKSNPNLSSKQVSLCTQMVNGMNELLSFLEVGNPHYIRCIKSNENKEKVSVDSEMVQEQIRNLGIRENVLVRRVGFCFYQTYEDFVARYRIVSKLTWPPKPSVETHPPANPNPNPGEQTNEQLYGKGKAGWVKWATVSILSAGEPSLFAGGEAAKIPPILLTEGSDYRLGKEKVFIRQPSSLQSLEDARHATLGHVAAVIQSFARTIVYWKQFKIMRKGVLLMASLQRKRIEQAKYRKTLAHLVSIQVKIRRFISKIRVQAMRRKFKNKPPRMWATRIQAWFRSISCRSKLSPEVRATALKCGKKVRFHDPKKIAGALALQMCLRNFIAKKKLTSIRKQFKNIPPRIYAKKLQCRYRGYNCRRLLDPVMANKIEKFLKSFDFHSPIRKQNAIRIQSKMRSLRVQKEIMKIMKKIRHIHRIVRGFLARQLKLRMLDTEFKGTLSLLSSSDGYELMKIANHGAGIGHVAKQALRKFKVTTADKGDHPIPPPAPPGGGLRPGAPTYVLGWNSNALFGRGGSGVPLTNNIQAVRIANPEDPASANPAGPKLTRKPSRRASATTGAGGGGVGGSKKGFTCLAFQTQQQTPILIIDCGNENTCQRLYRCVVRLGALSSAPPPVDVANCFRKSKTGHAVQKPTPRPSFVQKMASSFAFSGSGGSEPPTSATRAPPTTTPSSPTTPPVSAPPTPATPPAPTTPSSPATPPVSAPPTLATPPAPTTPSSPATPPVSAPPTPATPPAPTSSPATPPVSAPITPATPPAPTSTPATPPSPESAYDPMPVKKSSMASALFNGAEDTQSELPPAPPPPPSSEESDENGLKPLMAPPLISKLFTPTTTARKQAQVIAPTTTSPPPPVPPPRRPSVTNPPPVPAARRPSVTPAGGPPPPVPPPRRASIKKATGPPPPIPPVTKSLSIKQSTPSAGAPEDVSKPMTTPTQSPPVPAPRGAAPLSAREKLLAAGRGRGRGRGGRGK